MKKLTLTLLSTFVAVAYLAPSAAALSPAGEWPVPPEGTPASTNVPGQVYPCVDS